jgi:sugar/nucleoside kinase (ribokinase family)
MASPGGPVVCFSYLAAASLWQVTQFPRPNYGAEVHAIEESIAADGVMVAAVIAALGLPSLLLANNVGDDGSGAHARNWLHDRGVETDARMMDGHPTPHVVVVGDDHHTRTFFPYLPGVADELEQLDLESLATASFAYVDGYAFIAKAASLAIRAAKAAGVPLLLNLGGDSPADVFDAIRGYPRLIVQTSVSEASAPELQRLAGHLQCATGAEWAVVTAGVGGAVAASKDQCLTSPAFRAEVHHTHCAGAAFSGGLLYGLFQGWAMHDCLDLGAASGALRCERGHDEPMPGLAELRAFMQGRERAPVPAAWTVPAAKTLTEAGVLWK